MNENKNIVAHCFRCGQSYTSKAFKFCPNCGHELSKFKQNAFSELITERRNWEAFALNVADEPPVLRFGVFYGLAEEIAMKFSNCDFILKLVPTEKPATMNNSHYENKVTVAIEDKRLQDVPVEKVESLLDLMSTDTVKYYKISTGIGDTVIMIDKLSKD